MIITCTTPWMVVMILGFYTRRGWYDPDALQVFNRRQRGGRYWLSGWNWRGMTAWWVGAVVGVLFTDIPGQFVGPLGDLANGIDISLPLSLAVAAVLYLAMLRLFPSPARCTGPRVRGWPVPSTCRCRRSPIPGRRARARPRFSPSTAVDTADGELVDEPMEDWLTENWWRTR